MNEFLTDYLFNNAVALVLATVKNPDTAKRYLPALTKVAAALTAVIQGFGAQQAAQLQAAIQKEQSKIPPTQP